MGEFVIEVDDPRRDDVRQLIEQHRMFAGGAMPPESIHVLDPDDDALDTDVTFISVRAEGELLGVGNQAARLRARRAEVDAHRGRREAAAA